MPAGAAFMVAEPQLAPFSVAPSHCSEPSTVPFPHPGGMVVGSKPPSKSEPSLPPSLDEHAVKRSIAPAIARPALCTLGMVDIAALRFDEANQLFSESLALSREVGDTWGLARGLHYSGELARYRGDDEQARLFYDESLTLYQDVIAR